MHEQRRNQKGVGMKYSKYNNPMIAYASLMLDDLRKNKEYQNNSKEAQLEFTLQYNRWMGVIRAEENRLSYTSGDWKEGREFSDI